MNTTRNIRFRINTIVLAAADYIEAKDTRTAEALMDTVDAELHWIKQYETEMLYQKGVQVPGLAQFIRVGDSIDTYNRRVDLNTAQTLALTSRVPMQVMRASDNSSSTPTHPRQPPTPQSPNR